MATEIADPFLLTAERNEEIKNNVLDTIADTVADAALLREHAERRIQAIAATVPRLTVSGTVPSPPGLPVFGVGLSLPDAPEAPDLAAPPDLGIPAMPALESAPSVASPQIDDFNPSALGANLPPPPTIVVPPLDAQRPELSTISVPSAPVLSRPMAPALDTIHIPAFDFSTMEYFDADAPVFVGDGHINAALQWHLTPYVPTLMDAVVANLQAMWQGGWGLPPAVEQALFDRAAGREDLTAQRDISAAALDFSSRGFTMPPGLMAARIDAIRADAQRNKLAAAREYAIKAAELQVENLKFACTQALAAEQLLHSIHDGQLKLGLEAARAELDAQLSVLNAQVAVFNARQSAWASQAQARRDELQTRLAAVRMALDAELAKGENNKERVALYEAQMRALQVDASLYETEMKGAQTQADIDRTRIEQYRAEVGAWAERIGALKVHADLYDSQMKGEASKASVLEAHARAFGAYVSGKVATVDAQSKAADAVHRSNELRLRAWTAQIDQSRANAQNYLGMVQSQVAAYEARVRAFSAEASAEEGAQRLMLTAEEAAARVAMQRYEVELRKYLADLEQLRQAAAMQLEAIKAAAQAESTLAAGRMAGMSIGASVGASANMQASGTRSDSVSV